MREKVITKVVIKWFYKYNFSFSFDYQKEIRERKKKQQKENKRAIFNLVCMVVWECQTFCTHKFKLFLREITLY